MYISSTVSVQLKGLKQFRKAVNEQLRGAAGPVHDALKLWGVRFRSFIQERFDLFSKGGGDWDDLAPSTIKQRRKGRKSSVFKLREIYRADPRKKDDQAYSGGGKPRILRNLGLLFGALAPIFAGAPGALQQFIDFGIRVGYGGPQRHGLGYTKSIATIADIASFHQEGNPPKLPQRKIIVKPPQRVINMMANDMRKGLAKIRR